MFKIPEKLIFDAIFFLSFFIVECIWVCLVEIFFKLLFSFPSAWNMLYLAACLYLFYLRIGIYSSVVHFIVIILFSWLISFLSFPLVLQRQYNWVGRDESKIMQGRLLWKRKWFVLFSVLTIFLTKKETVYWFGLRSLRNSRPFFFFLRFVSKYLTNDELQCYFGKRTQ